MKINELVINITNKDFNLAESLQVKTYLPLEIKKTIAQGIIYECTSDEDGAIKVDSVQKYLSYVRYMITMYTNLEYKDEDYDTLCSTGYNGISLLNAILDCFMVEAQECLKILNLMFEDHMRENEFGFVAAKFLNKITDSIGDIADLINEKISGLDLQSLIPEDMDVEGLNKFLSEYIN